MATIIFVLTVSVFSCERKHIYSFSVCARLCARVCKGYFRHYNIKVISQSIGTVNTMTPRNGYSPVKGITHSQDKKVKTNNEIGIFTKNAILFPTYSMN